jgi:hypothetical protein
MSRIIPPSPRMVFPLEPNEGQDSTRGASTCRIEIQFGRNTRVILFCFGSLNTPTKINLGLF